jgi:superfamily I DNA/RNA helicase
MEFRIADTFTDAMVRLTNEEQKAVKTTVFDLQMDPSGNSLRFHKLKRARDKHFWSVSVNMDLRIIVHRGDNSLLVCYVDHHDNAYDWAANRKLEVHPKTGAAQIVEVLETVKEIEQLVYKTREVAQPKVTYQTTSSTDRPPLAGYDKNFLLEYGIPEAWLEALQKASEDMLYYLVEHLPDEAAEAVLEFATGNIPDKPQPAPADVNPFDHPDAQRRFRSIDNQEELQAALDYPWDKWTIFLHPAQRILVDKDFSGPARVSGTAGTGKTVVALHRAVHLARINPEGRILLTTFSDALANALRQKCRRLVQHEPQLMEQIDVYALDTLGKRLYQARGGRKKLANDTTIQQFLGAANAGQDGTFTDHFLWKEWSEVVDPWQINTWEDYRDVRRIGRKTRLPESKRKALWDVFAPVQERLAQEDIITLAGIFQFLAEHFEDRPESAPYQFMIVDEAQDISVPQLRFLSAMAQDKANSLFFAGDLGQRIFQSPFSWASLGVQIRGRSNTLRINYRTSHQIRQQADRLLDPEISDVDGITESRQDAQSVFNGPPPELIHADDTKDEQEQVAAWIRQRLADGVEPEEIAVFVRSETQIPRARQAIQATGQQVYQLDERLQTKEGAVTLSTMHLAKGLEFKAVVVMAVDEDVMPDPDRIAALTDQQELEDIYNTERHLLYVACTRARDYLLIACAEEPSEFLEDMVG